MLIIGGKYFNIQYFDICGNSKVGVWEFQYLQYLQYLQ